jgi:hypothetical protein
MQTKITSIGKRSRFVVCIFTRVFEYNKFYTNAVTAYVNATKFGGVRGPYPDHERTPRWVSRYASAPVFFARKFKITVIAPKSS